MMTETTLAQLRTLTYRADAQRRVCWLPLGGIFWDDELPRAQGMIKFPEEDRTEIVRLFGIRVRLRKGEPVSDEERLLWDLTRSQLPEWPLFQRLTISPDDLQAQEEAEQATTEVVEQLFADADEVAITEKDGIQRISATFDLTKGRPARTVYRKNLVGVFVLLVLSLSLSLTFIFIFVLILVLGLLGFGVLNAALSMRVGSAFRVFQACACGSSSPVSALG
jgi:hypothetical protein